MQVEASDLATRYLLFHIFEIDSKRPDLTQMHRATNDTRMIPIDKIVEKDHAIQCNIDKEPG